MAPAPRQSAVLAPLLLLQSALAFSPGAVVALPTRPHLSPPCVQCVQQPLLQNPQQSARVAALIAVPLAWGTYGPAVKLAYELPHVPAAPVLQASFQLVSFSGLILAGAVSSWRQQAAAAEDSDGDSGGGAFAIDLPTARAGLELGMWLFLGQAFQLQGLQRTDAAKAGFFVQLTTLFVPLAEALFLGRTLAPRVWAACASATAGIAIISAEALMQDGSGAGGSTLVGDGLVAISALLYTTHVIRLGEYASSISPLPLARAKAGAQLLYGFGTIAAVSLSGGIGTCHARTHAPRNALGHAPRHARSLP